MIPAVQHDIGIGAVAGAQEVILVQINRSANLKLYCALIFHPLGRDILQRCGEAGRTDGADLGTATDPFGNQREVSAYVTGVMRQGLFGEAFVASSALREEMFAAQTRGLPAFVSNVFQSAVMELEPGSSAERKEAIKAELKEHGLAGIPLEDQLGAIDAVITGLVWVLNGFAIIALIAAGFGIINTLLMSVQERTREIGLMKAMGMGAGKIFGLFSAEAVFIGFLGSAIGAVVAIVLGSVISNVLANTVFSDLQGLRILAFDWVSVVGVVLLVMVIAFLAGTLPARRAARRRSPRPRPKRSPI